MDPLFTVDNMQTQKILDTACKHLSLDELIVFEEVTPLSGMAVATHQYSDLIQLGRDNLELTARLTDPDSGERLRGPRITNAAIVLSLNKEAFKNMVRPDDGSPKVPKVWHWMMSTIVLRAAHLKHLKLSLDTYLDESFCDTSRISEPQFKALNLHADSLLTGITFSQCTHLRIDLYLDVTKKVRQLLVLNLLKHFPNLENIVLEGDRLPRISLLPAPQKLKRLKLSISDEGDLLLADQLIVSDFSGLESLSFMRGENIDGQDMIEDEHSTRSAD